MSAPDAHKLKINELKELLKKSIKKSRKIMEVHARSPNKKLTDNQREKMDRLFLSVNVMSAYKAIIVIDAGLCGHFRDQAKASKITMSIFDGVVRRSHPAHIPLSTHQIKYEKAAEAAKSAEEKRCLDAGIPYIESSCMVGYRNERRVYMMCTNVSLMISQSMIGYYGYDGVNGGWFKFQSTHWHRCQQVDVKQIIQELIHTGTYDHDDLVSGDTGSRVSNTIKLVMREPVLKLDLQPNHEYIPFLNGMLNIKTGQLEQPTAKTALAYCLPHEYRNGSKCKRFKKWLRWALRDDESTVQFIRAFIAAIITGRADLQKFLALIGFPGSGKSTLLAVMADVVGARNSFATSFDLIAKDVNALGDLPGRRLILLSDADAWAGSISRFKCLTGGDPVPVKRLYENINSQYVYDGMVVVTANSYIASSDTSTAIDRRMRAVRFDRVPSENEKNNVSKENEEGLIGVFRNELTEIINWSLELSRDQVTEIINAGTEHTRRVGNAAQRHGNKVADWVMECCEFGDDFVAQLGIKNSPQIRCLYPNFVYYCEQMGSKSMSCWKFRESFESVCASKGYKVSYVRRGRNGNAHFVGVQLNERAQSFVTERNSG